MGVLIKNGCGVFSNPSSFGLESMPPRYAVEDLELGLDRQTSEPIADAWQWATKMVLDSGFGVGRDPDVTDLIGQGVNEPVDVGETLVHVLLWYVFGLMRVQYTITAEKPFFGPAKSGVGHEDRFLGRIVAARERFRPLFDPTMRRIRTLIAATLEKTEFVTGNFPNEKGIFVPDCDPTKTC